MPGTEKAIDKILVIGWDVGGWMSSNHGFAVLEYAINTDKIFWKGLLNNKAISEDKLLKLKSVIDDCGLSGKIERKTGKIKLFQDYKNVVLGVDAPLGLPYKYHDFIDNSANIINRPPREIDNPLAYRRTDRLIYKKFNKKPLSATFDRLGTSYTVAMAHVRSWKKKHNFTLIPQEKQAAQRQIIEVYPGLIKKLKTEFSECEKFFQIIPEEISAGNHSYDAALSALQALAVLLDGQGQLPKMEKPERVDEILSTEGWIFFPAVNK